MLLSSTFVLFCIFHAIYALNHSETKLHVFLSMASILLRTFFAQDKWIIFKSTAWLPAFVLIQSCQRERQNQVVLLLRLLLVASYSLTTSDTLDFTFTNRKCAAFVILLGIATVTFVIISRSKFLQKRVKTRINTIFSSKSTGFAFLVRVMHVTLTIHVFFRICILPLLNHFVPPILANILITPFQFTHLHRVRKSSKNEPCLFCIASYSTQMFFIILENMEHGCLTSSIAFYILTLVSCR